MAAAGIPRVVTPCPGSSVQDQINYLINQINGFLSGLNPEQVDITGGTIDGTVIGATVPAAGTFTTLAATSGTIGGDTITTNTASQTLTNKALTSPAITGGTMTGAVVNNTIIGLTTAAAAAFTTLQATTLNSAGVVTTDASGNFATNSTLPAARFPILTGNITTAGGSLATATAAFTGDITTPANSFITTIANNAVTYAKFQQVAASSLVGNATGSLANATGITLGATLAFSGAALQTNALSGDVTSSANSFVTAISKIVGTAIAGTTGTASSNVVLSASPTLSGAPFLAAATATTAAAGDSSTKVPTTAWITQNARQGFRNPFRNGNMQVAQRGTTGTITSGSPAYCVDGWILSCTGADITWQQNSTYGLPNSGPTVPNYLAVVGNTSNTDISIKQRIEGADAGALAGQTVTFQMTISNNTGGNLTPTLVVNYANSLDNWGASTSILAATNLQTISNSGFGTLCYTFTMSGSPQNGLEFIVDFGAQNSNAKNISITAAMVFVTPGVSTGTNSNPPPIEFAPASYEMLRCQRYFQSTFPIGTNIGQNAGVAGAITVKNPIALGDPSDYWQFSQPMRAAPTIVTYNPSAANANWRDITAAADATVSVDPSSTKSQRGVLIATSGTVTTLGDILAIHASASAEL